MDRWFNRPSQRPTHLERLDELFADPEGPRALVVNVDAWTSLGGSQFVDSPATGRYVSHLAEDVWARWQAWDPVRMAPRHADALRSMRAIWIDAGRRDEWSLDLGAQAVATACHRRWHAPTGRVITQDPDPPAATAA